MITKYDKAIEITKPGMFMPTGDAYKVLRGVAKAISKDETHRVFNFIKVEKCRIVATDGLRLHMCDNLLKIPEGLWKPVINTAKVMLLLPCMDETTKYPNYKQVIPVMDNYIEITDNPELTMVLGALGKADCYANIDYMKQATDKKTSCPDGYGVHADDQFSPIVVLGKACGYKAVVMPLRTA